jgi:hypothetical protein
MEKAVRLLLPDDEKIEEIIIAPEQSSTSEVTFTDVRFLFHYQLSP